MEVRAIPKPKADKEKLRAEQDQRYGPGYIHTRELRVTMDPREDRSVELSFSSEEPVRRYDWWEDQYYSEILSHSHSDEVDLNRILEIGVLLWNHDPDHPIGRIENAWVDETERKCKAIAIFDKDEESEKLFQKVLSGTLRGISVGYQVSQWEKVKEGVRVGEIDGPAMVARKWMPYEVSLVSVPADMTVGIGRNINIETRSDGEVKFFERMKELGAKIRSEKGTLAQYMREAKEVLREAVGADDYSQVVDEMERGLVEFSATPPAEEVRGADNTEALERAAANTERSRISEITSLCRDFSVDPQTYIENGTEVDTVRAQILEKMRTEQEPANTSRAQVVNDEKDKFRGAVVDGLRMRSGSRIEHPAPGAEGFRGISLMDLARESLIRSGEHVGYAESRMDVARRAFSTDDFPVILGGLARATLADSYKTAPSTWEAWCGVGSLSDFKEQTTIKLSETTDLELVPEGGEYKFGHFSESKDSIRLYTYGKKFALTRQAIINDDLRAFTRLPQKFGSAAKRTINKAVYAILVNNTVKMAEDGKILFHDDHSNIGTDGVIGTVALSEARSMMRKQQDPEKLDVLNIYPSFLLVPPELETSAEQVLLSTADIKGINAGVINPFRDKFQIICDAQLTSAVNWFLAASSSLVDTIEVAFLDGVNAPTIEQQPGWDVDGMEWKVRLDFGIKCWDYRGLFKNPGKAEEV